MQDHVRKQRRIAIIGQAMPYEPVAHPKRFVPDWTFGIRDAELYYWSGDEARVTNWRTGQVRVIARYDPAIRQTSTLIPRDPTVTAIEAAPAKHSSVAWEGGDIRLTGLDGTERHVPVDLDKLRR